MFQPFGSLEFKAMHSSVVMRLPRGGIRLAANSDTPVEAAEIQHGRGIFWGVQNHPELSLGKIAASTAHQADDVIDQGLARDKGEVGCDGGANERPRDHPHASGFRLAIGLSAEIVRFERHTREIENFLEAIKAGVLRPI